jgi:predicted metal-binding protein
MRIKDKDKINKNDVIRLNRCLLNPDDPYYDYAWNSEWGALAKQLMSEQGIPVKIY